MSSFITSTDGRDPAEVRAEQQAEGNRLHRSYIVLTPEERAKGFIRPFRNAYRHVGPPGPKHPLRDLDAEEHARYDEVGYVKFEAYPETVETGRFWTQADLDRIGRGCGRVTTMSDPIAGTYARNPSFYGSTYCTGCGAHFPVGDAGEFVWEGSEERVGS